MKNNQQQILCEIKSLMTSIKTQLEELENKISEYEQSIDVQDLPVEEVAQEPIEEPCVEPVENEPVVEVEDDIMDIELEPSDDLPFYDDMPVSEPETFSEPEVVAESETVPEPEVVAEPDAEVEPETENVSEPVKIPVFGQEQDQDQKQKPAPVPVIDAMTAKQPWRTDMPGSPVRDIRSAISLNDRILFINYLFGEDPMAFQQMLTQLNAMGSFDEAAAHVIAAHPEWDLESDTVYRFMMALRRRHQ
jgi:hypothetical protein